MNCIVCESSKTKDFRVIDTVNYYECSSCKSLFADPQFIAKVERGDLKNYGHEYWESELSAARQRSFGSSLIRVAETFFYCRIPIKKFIDIGSGPGYLLDALRVVMPESESIFHGVELFPPDERYRSKHPNYKNCSLLESKDKYSAGVCIEVIEHMSPRVLRSMLMELAQVSEEGATYIFNSGQPEFVKKEDPQYLDPLIRGHIVSYSIEGLRAMFSDAGFRVTRLPGRTWAFLAEFANSDEEVSASALEDRLWVPVNENAIALRDKTFGPLMYDMGIESALCYFRQGKLNEVKVSSQVTFKGMLRKIKRRFYV
jgi:hypothetical protein